MARRPPNTSGNDEVEWGEEEGFQGEHSSSLLKTREVIGSERQGDMGLGDEEISPSAQFGQEEEDFDIFPVSATSQPQTPAEAKSTLEKISEMIDDILPALPGFFKEIKDNVCTLKDELGATIFEGYMTPPVTPARHGTRPAPARAPLQQSVACKIYDPAKLGGSFIQNYLTTSAKFTVNCNTLQAALKFIALSGKEAHRLKFNFEGPLKKHEAEIKQALAAEIAKHSPPTNPNQVTLS